MSVEAKSTKPVGTNRKEYSPLGRVIRRFGIQIGIVAVALIVWMFFVMGRPARFCRTRSTTRSWASTPYFAMVAIPLTLVVITKEIDLSFPSIMAWGMAIYALVMGITGVPLLAFIACLAAGAFAGWLNGAIVTKIGIPSLVATIGTQFFWRGVVLVMRNGNGQSLATSKDARSSTRCWSAGSSTRSPPSSSGRSSLRSPYGSSSTATGSARRSI